MRHRSRALLGPIVHGLLAAGLCTLVAAAQQPASPAVADATAPLHAPVAKAKDKTAVPATAAPAADVAGDANSNTGVANPDPVTPSDSGDGPMNGPAATAEPSDNPAIHDSPRFFPDQPQRPLSADHDSDTPAKPDPPAPPPSAEIIVAAPVKVGPPSAPTSTDNWGTQQATPPTAAPEAAPEAAPQTAPETIAPAVSPATPAPVAPAAAAPQASTPPADSSATPAQQNAPAPPDNAPPAATAQETAPPAVTPAADVNAPAPQQAAPPAPSAPETPSAAPASGSSNPPAPSAPAADSSVPAPAPQIAPPTPPTAADSPAQQPAAPATPSAPPATNTAQNPAAPSAASSSIPATDTAAPAPVSQDQTQIAPPASSAPADTAAPQQTAPATPPAAAATPDASSNPPGPAADTNAPASAPGSADQSPATPGPAGTDNQAVNPSLPSQQVNQPEPPPASRIDIFGGYAYLRPSGSVGTWSFPSNNTRGYIASGTYYFKRHIGVQAEFSHSEYPLGTTGTSPAPPFVQLGGVTDSFYTVEAGPVYRFFLGQHIIPFVHFTGGGAKVAGPKFQPPTWGYGFAGGGGVDLLLPHTHDHVAFRLAQADYGYMHADQGALQQYDLAGGTESVSALRLSAGLVIRFGEMNPVQSKSLACDASPAEVYAGERVTLAATLRNYRDRTKHPFFFSWVLTAGKQQGFGPVIFVDTTGLAAGTYHATAHISLKEKGKQFAQCGTNFVVKESPAPTVKCSPDPSTVTPGQVSIITAYAGSIAQRQLTYSYLTSEGQINGKDNTAELHTDGLPPGVATVTCKVQDDLGRSAVATTEVTIAPPSLPPAPKAQPLCTVYFNRDMRRPARVDNEGRACLDDVALTMEHQPDARLVLVGEHSDSEVDGQLTAAERAMNTRAYLANEKGIDPSRVDVRTSTTPGRQVQTYLLAPGAVFDQPTEGRIDESKIKIHGQQYAHQPTRAPQKGPVGQGVSHPPRN